MESWNLKVIAGVTVGLVPDLPCLREYSGDYLLLLAVVPGVEEASLWGQITADKAQSEFVPISGWVEVVFFILLGLDICLKCNMI